MPRRVFKHPPVRRLATLFGAIVLFLFAVLTVLAVANDATRRRVDMVRAERQTIATQVFLSSQIVDIAERYAEARDEGRPITAGEHYAELQDERATLVATRRCGQAKTGAFNPPPAVRALFLDDRPGAICELGRMFFTTLERFMNGSLTRRLAIARMRGMMPSIREKLIEIDALYAEQEARLRVEARRFDAFTEVFGVAALLSCALIFLTRGLPLVVDALDEAERAAAALRDEAEEARRARDAAERADRIKAEFLARLSHEVRTPLNAVIGLTALIDPHALEDEDRRNIALIRRNGEDLGATLDAMIDLSRLSAGDATLESTVFNLGGAVRSVCARHREGAAAHGLDLAVVVDSAVEGAWIGDERRVRRVVAALVENAIKFTPAGRIAVALTRWGEDGVRLTVDDSGPGVPEARREEVFETFTQGDGSATRAHGGLGQGLAHVRAIARAMGGEAGVTGSELGGARFFVLLPLLSLGSARRRGGVARA